MKKSFLIFIGILLVKVVLAQNTLDASFDASQISSAPNFMSIRTILVQPDGKILFGGTSDYDNAPGSDGPSFGRLNSDGSWDAPFQNNVGYTPNTGFYFTPGGIIERSMVLNGGVAVRDLLLLPDGKIIVVGDFARFNNTPVISIARLNPNGTIDNFGERDGFTDYFSPGFPTYGINAVARQSDGRLIIGGNFTATGDGTLTFGYIARVDANGLVDTRFSGMGSPAEIGFNAGIDDLEMQPDGDVLVAGHFSAFRNVPCGPLARLNLDYTLDAAFFAAQGTGFNIGQVTKIALQRDGKIIVAGSFTSFNGLPRAGILRLNSDGSLDQSFTSGTGPSGSIFSLTLQQDGKILVGGNFNSFNGIPRSGIARLNQNGSIDTSLDPGSGIGGRPNDNVMGVYALSQQPNGRILAGGDIGSYDGTSRYSIVRLIDSALPVNLISFEVKVEGTQAILNWATSLENNSELFAIERSGDGKIWETIGSVNASKESQVLKRYSFIDQSPLEGSNLYRLKMTDIDQSFAYSRMESAVFEGANPLIIYPNPAQDVLYLKNVSSSFLRKVTLYDQGGRKVKSYTSIRDALNVSKLNSGTYILVFQFKNGTTQSSTFLIQH